jgi:hypothetical protein
VIVKYADVINWKELCKNKRLDLEIVRRFENKVDWDIISNYSNLDQQFLFDFRNNLDWSIISYLYKITNPELLKYVEKQNNWLYLSKDEKLEKIKPFYDFCEIHDNIYINCYILANGYCDPTNADNEIFIIDEDLDIKFDKHHNTLESSHCPFNSKFCYKSQKVDKFGGFICYQNSNLLHEIYGSSGYGYNIVKVRVPIEKCCVMEINDYYLSLKIGCMYATEITFDSVIC